MDIIKVYYFNMGNFFLNIFYNYKSKIFFLNDIKDNNQNTNKNKLYWKFYFFYYLQHFSNFFPNFFKSMIKSFMDRFNSNNHNLIKIKVTNGKLNRQIIYKNQNLSELVHRVKNLHNEHKEHIFNENEMMMNKRHPVLDIYYKDATNNKVSVKNLLVDYADKSKHHENNTLNHIFEIENITVPNNKIYVLFLKMIKREEKEFDLSSSNYHVSDIFE